MFIKETSFENVVCEMAAICSSYLSFIIIL